MVLVGIDFNGGFGVVIGVAAADWNAKDFTVTFAEDAFAFAGIAFDFDLVVVGI